jgi:hypothetical protein
MRKFTMSTAGENFYTSHGFEQVVKWETRDIPQDLAAASVSFMHQLPVTAFLTTTTLLATTRALPTTTTLLTTTIPTTTLFFHRLLTLKLPQRINLKFRSTGFFSNMHFQWMKVSLGATL